MAARKDSEKALAREYYFTSMYSQKQICELLGISEKTFSGWKEAEGWEETKKAKSAEPVKIMMKMQSQLIELQTFIEAKEEGKRYPDSKEADIQNKIAAGILKLQTGNSLSENVTVLTQFLRFLAGQNNDMDFIKRVTENCHIFLKSKSEELV